MPFSSYVPHFLQHAQVYCQKILPLVFDNSLSYYEFLGHVSHKLNECIKAINSQNLEIVEFEKMVSLEIEKYEEYMNTRQTEFEDEIKTAWNLFKEVMKEEWNAFKSQLESEWADEKEINRVFREEMTVVIENFKAEITQQQQAFESRITESFEEYKDNVNAEITQFETTVNADLSEFKALMQTQQNNFESHITQLFTDFTTDETNARATFENRYAQLFDQWKIDTLNALTQAIGEWETTEEEKLKAVISTEIHTLEVKLTNRLSELDRAIVTEKTERERVTADLQSQIYGIQVNGGIGFEKNGTTSVGKSTVKAYSDTDTFILYSADENLHMFNKIGIFTKTQLESYQFELNTYILLLNKQVTENVGFSMKLSQDCNMFALSCNTTGDQINTNVNINTDNSAVLERIPANTEISVNTVTVDEAFSYPGVMFNCYANYGKLTLTDTNNFKYTPMNIGYLNGAGGNVVPRITVDNKTIGYNDNNELSVIKAVSEDEDEITLLEKRELNISPTPDGENLYNTEFTIPEGYEPIIISRLSLYNYQNINNFTAVNTTQVYYNRSCNVYTKVTGVNTSFAAIWNVWCLIRKIS